MSTTRTEIKIPANRLDACRAELAKAHGKLCKSAARAGEAAPAAPAITVLSDAIEARCHLGCEGAHAARAVGLDCERCDGGVLVRFGVIVVAIDAPPPVVGSWELLAVVEPLNGESLIRQVPGAVLPEGFTFAPWHGATIVCDHCRTARKRTETFLVRATGEGETPAGTIRQVGRNCLSAFLGDLPFADLVARLAWPDLVRCAAGCDDEGGCRPSSDDSHATAEWLAWSVSVTRVRGFISKAQAASRGAVATAVTVADALNPPFGGAESRAAWRKLRAECEPTDADRADAAAITLWLSTRDASSEYDRSLALVARGERVARQHGAILTSAVSAYRREHAPVRDAAAAPSAHVGEVGKRAVLELTVERVVDCDTDYGILHIHTFRDASGNALVWRTTSRRIESGTRVVGKATVKAHSEYRGERQTELTRCAF